MRDWLTCMCSPQGRAWQRGRDQRCAATTMRCSVPLICAPSPASARTPSWTSRKPLAGAGPRDCALPAHCMILRHNTKHAVRAALMHHAGCCGVRHLTWLMACQLIPVLRILRRFGLGWNSVYHFTDVPSFCSGDNIVLFDPHAKWVLHACRASRCSASDVLRALCLCSVVQAQRHATLLCTRPATLA
jgi:hypothetical protein